ALPLGPSNEYFLSTATHGIRRRSAASASRARVSSFSFTRSCWRAASHCCGETIGGVSIGRCPFGVSIFPLLPLLSIAELAHDHRGDAARGGGARRDHGDCRQA